MQVTITRKAHFNAAHRLAQPHWPDEKNAAVYGKCANANYHGHNYNLEVSVTGPIDPETGYVMDLKILADLIEAEVTERFDHKNLNLDVPDFADLLPTAEHIAVVAWRRMRALLPDHLILSVRLFETDRNFVDYHGN